MWLDIIQVVLPILIAGIGSIGFYNINKKIKHVELQDKLMDVKTKEIENSKKESNRWKELYEEEKSKRDVMETKLEGLYQQCANFRDLISDLKFKNQNLSWYRCTVNNCSNRRPPHVYDKDGNELEACSN